MSRYHTEQDQKNDEKIESMRAEFPLFIGEYLDDMVEKNHSSKTRLSYLYDLRSFFSFLAESHGIAGKDIEIDFLAALSPQDIQHYLSYLTRYRTASDIAYNKAHPYAQRKYHTNSPLAKARKLACVRGLYKYLMKCALLESNPAALVSVPKDKRKNSDIVAMDNEEVSLMLNQAHSGDSLSGRQKSFAKHTKYRDTAILSLLVGTGLRVSELVGIDLLDIDKNTDSIMVFRKEGKEQRVYMPKEVATSIYDYIELERKSEKAALFVSPRTSDRLSVRSIERIVKKYTASITNQDLHTHSLRSTYATNLYQNTEDIKLVADALGHSNLATVSRYSKSGEMNRKRAAKLVNYSVKKERDE